MDRKHMMETFRRAHDHKGSAFVEIYQNCNVFNDGAFEAITARDARPDMLIDLKHGEPIRFGKDRDRGVVATELGHLEIVDVASVGEDRLLVHDETRPEPTLAFALSRLADAPTVPTPMGVFRAVQRPVYGDALNSQIAAAQDREGPGDLAAILGSGSTWEV
jgi:2-oxoglutarate ferredoxin oxidoreductase subunit beta